MPTSDAYTFPAVHARDLVELAESLGVQRARLLHGLRVDPVLLTDPEARMALPQLEALIARACELTGQPLLGLSLGLRMRVPVHGFLGFAIMASATLRDGLSLVARYTPTRTNALAAELTVADDEASLYLDELTDLGAARDCILTALAVSIWQISQAQTQARFPVCCEFTFAAPPGADAHGVPNLTLRYEKPRNRLRFAARHLDLTVPNAHPMGYELAREKCEQTLQELNEEELLPRVRALLWRADSDEQSLEHVAHELAMSRSTLKRKLKTAGAQFSDLLDEAQRERACTLLRTQRLSIEQVAEKVGYTDVSNFTRAFRRWTGVTPAAYRRGLKVD